MTSARPLPTSKDNPAFSETMPGLQIAWDSTSIGALKTCPRYYQYAIVYGLQSKDLNVHLRFGLAYHEALEAGDKAEALGATRAEAQLTAVMHAMKVTWDAKMKRPWLSDDPNKNRGTLVRSVAWYYEEFPVDPLKTVMMAGGRPAVELSCSMPLGLKAGPTGEDYLLCGHLDRVIEYGERGGPQFILDRKSTKSTLSKFYFQQFQPHNQFSTYTLLGKMAFSLPIRGIIVDACQSAVGFSRYERSPPISHTADQDAEWLKDLRYYLRLAERFAEAGYWPMNDKACYNCDFKAICARSPASRDQWLKTEFHQRVWNPLEIRGDV